MKKIKFINWDIIIVNGEKMGYNHFFSLMGDNGGKNSFFIVSDKRNNQKFLCYEDECYEIAFSDKVNEDLKRSILNHEINDKMQFTDWNTVIINNKEITLNKFFQIMDDNIESSNYDVTYYEECTTFIVCFDGKIYEVSFSEKVMNDFRNSSLTPIIRHLLALSRIQKIVDVTNGEKDLIINDLLDNDSRALYLKKLQRNRKFSLRKYFMNIKDDLQEAWNNTKYALYDRWNNADLFWEILFLIGALAGGFLALSFGEITESERVMIMLWIMGGALSSCIPIPVVCVFFQLKMRIKRLISNIENIKFDNYKIKHLESMVHEREKTDDRVIGLESNVLDEQQGKDMILVNEIPKIIDRLLELLSGVDALNRSNLTSELRLIVLDYQKLSQDNFKADAEIAYVNRHLMDRIVDLELKISEALKQNKEAKRANEIEYLLEKIDELEEEKGKAYQKRLK